MPSYEPITVDDEETPLLDTEDDPITIEDGEP